ncbi:MAG: HD domain-containing protein [Desulfococcaceae bacterium]
MSKLSARDARERRPAPPFQGELHEFSYRENTTMTIHQKLIPIARPFFDDARGSHGWDHTLRVAALCEEIGRREGADLDVLAAAALLHDIGRRDQDEAKGAVCHAERSAELAGPILAGLNGFSPEWRKNVLHCVRTHRFRGKNVPETPEARVLFDADKLDAIGAVGVARAYLFAGEIGAALHSPNVDVTVSSAYSRDDTGYREYRVKLLGIRDRMLTETGREMAEERHRFMVAFFDRFLAEVEGKS